MGRCYELRIDSTETISAGRVTGAGWGEGIMANETYGNKNCTEILNTKDYTVPGGRNLSSAPCSDSSCVYLCKRKNANGVGTCIGPGKQAKCHCVYECP
ncbi:hypothetical protein Bca4012_068613 [Brassica carinata]